MAKENNKSAAAARETAAEAPKQKFYIPELDRSIEANSIEEAVEIANKELKK